MSPTWPEAREAKRQRQLQEERAIRSHMLGRECVVCGTRMVQVVCDYDGSNSHACCDPQSQALIRAERERKASR